MGGEKKAGEEFDDRSTLFPSSAPCPPRWPVPRPNFDTTLNRKTPYLKVTKNPNFDPPPATFFISDQPPIFPGVGGGSHNSQQDTVACCFRHHPPSPADLL